MANSHQSVAVCLLSLLCLYVSKAAEVTEAPLSADSYREVFDRYSYNGYALTADEVLKLLQQEYTDYVQKPNIALVKELMGTYDTDNNGLDLEEFKNLSDFITKNRN